MAMVEFKDYYKTLGVGRTATEKEIKAAYRKLARKHHPDLNPGNKQAEARIKEINEAHEVLSDPEKRRRYDQLGADWSSGYRPGAGGGRPGAHWPAGFRVETEGFDAEEPFGFSEFFRTFFGGGAAAGGARRSGLDDLFEQARRGRAQQQVADHEEAIELTLEEVARGANRILEIMNGPKRRRVEVKIPAGVREGSRVRVAGEGAGDEGGRGDLYLRVHVLPHPRFERAGDDLKTTLRVPLTAVVLGGEVQVPTLDGTLEIKVPAGTPPDRQFRLRGKGLPRLEAKGERGDLLASVSADVPKDLSKRERELFEELRKLGR